MSLGRSTLIPFLILIVSDLSLSDTMLFDDRIDVQQKTEIRYDVPDGCVITGLGFRAAYDNITTMHCRYHRLSPNGTLADPNEVQLGSEPNHACEAKILLPDGYVAVGFGAAGEPEWDVTLLRIWARALKSDGTLGDIKTFSDGFKPDREPERDVVLTASDRVLTGAGLRFASNDIGGIYARSKRILNLTDNDRAKLANFKTRAWALTDCDGLDIDRLAADIKKYNVNRLDIDFYFNQNKLRAEHLSAFEKLHAAVPQLQIYLVVGLYERAEVLRTIKDTPAITGIIIDTFFFFHGPPDMDIELRELRSDWTKAGHTMQSECSRAGKKLNLNFALTHAGPDLPRLVSQLPKEVGVIIPAEFARIWRIKSGRIPQFDSRNIFVTFNLAPHSTHLAPLPDVRIDQLPGYLLDSALAGADGLIVPIDTGGLYLPDTINSLSLGALYKLATDPLQSTDALWNEFCEARYGPSSGRAVAALRRTPEINDLLFGIFGKEGLWFSFQVFEVDPSEHLKHLASLRNPGTDTTFPWYAPDQRTIDRAMQEKETASWLLDQSISDANHAHSANPTPQTRELLDSMLKLKSAADFWRDLTQAYLYTKMYAIDGAPGTRAKAELPLARLRDPNSYQVRFDGYTRFVRSAEEFLAKYEHKALLVRALQPVRDLSDAGKHEEAAAELRLVLTTQEFVPHIDKHNRTIAEIASSLQALGGTSPDIAVMRHGDGRWLIEKVAGRWSYQIGDSRPCLYLDFLPGPLETPTDYILSFEYFNKGDWKLHFNYDSAYPPEQKREYHPAEPLQLTNTKTWKKHSFGLTNCRFGSGQNDGADMRFVTGNGANIRNIRLQPK
jgi:hypothetical protein